MSSIAAARVMAVGLTVLVLASEAATQDLERGRRLYDRWCAECHGVNGKGDGSAAAYMLPRPRDFTLGIYQIRTTPNGELPTDEDVERTIKVGMPGTAMPGWESKFNQAEIRDVVAYIKTFSRFFEQLGEPNPLAFGKPPRLTEEGLAEGRRFYREIECFKCHGDAGRGDGPSAPTLQDDLDFPARPADLTKNWSFNGGGTVDEIYRRLRTGLDGSPMPSFSDLIDAGFMTDEQLWHVAQYVRSLAPDDPPRVREVITATLVEAELPASPDDLLWDETEPFYIPMVGQVIRETRWFAPTVDGLWVKAAHNGEELALMITWHDPSRSPNPAWLEWQQWIAQSIYPFRETGGAELFPDRLTVQFPMSIPTGRERPYFLMGDSRRPVYLWQWISDPEQALEARATGLGSARALAAGSRTLTWSSSWDQGEWRVQFRRRLATADSVNALQFLLGEAIPIAFFAWDGSNGESGTQMAISSWYAIHLELPASSTVYLSPVAAILATAALGFLVIWRAQRREEEERSS